MMLTRHQLRKIREAIPKGDPDGLYVHDSSTGEQIFLTFDILHNTCKEIMDDRNAALVRDELGKFDWREDPTYNMKRK